MVVLLSLTGNQTRWVSLASNQQGKRQTSKMNLCLLTMMRSLNTQTMLNICKQCSRKHYHTKEITILSQLFSNSYVHITMLYFKHHKFLHNLTLRSKRIILMSSKINGLLVGEAQGITKHFSHASINSFLCDHWHCVKVWPFLK